MTTTQWPSKDLTIPNTTWPTDRRPQTSSTSVEPPSDRMRPRKQRQVRRHGHAVPSRGDVDYVLIGREGKTCVCAISANVGCEILRAWQIRRTWSNLPGTQLNPHIGSQSRKDMLLPGDTLLDAKWWGGSMDH